MKTPYKPVEIPRDDIDDEAWNRAMSRAAVERGEPAEPPPLPFDVEE